MEEEVGVLCVGLSCWKSLSIMEPLKDFKQRHQHCSYLLRKVSEILTFGN